MIANTGVIPRMNNNDKVT